MRISALLAAKGDAVATITAQTTVTGAVDALRAHGVGALVVSSDGQHIDGIVHGVFPLTGKPCLGRAWRCNTTGMIWITVVAGEAGATP